MEYRFPETIDITPELMQPLTTAIGSVVLAWGSAESALNINVALIFQMAGGKHHAEQEEIPVALKRKLIFLRRCFQKIEALAPFREDGLKLFDRMGRLAKSRNELIHAFLSEVDGGRGLFTFTSLGSVKETPLIKGQVRVTIPEIMQLGLEIMQHGAAIADFTQRLSKTFIPEQPRQK